jgi:prepilin-type N-terminal cleavage/methylation domain-containing protein
MVTKRYKAGPDRSGVTLVELLVAMSILLIFGSLAVTTLMYGSRMFRTGHRRSFAYEVASIVFDQLDDDISGASSQFWGKGEEAFDTRIKFWVDHDDEFAGNPDHEGGRQRLRLVRSIPDQTVNARIRAAGDGLDNADDGPIDEEWYNLKDDDDDTLVDEDLASLEGLCEVAYVLGRDADDTRTLYRAVLAPIGYRDPDATTGDGGDTGVDRFGTTFFHGVDEDGDDDPDDGDADALGTSDRIQKKAVVLAEDVLHFEVRLWTQYTNTWDIREPDGTLIDFDRWADPNLPEHCRPLLTWDSDRLVQDTATTDPEISTPFSLMDPGVGDFPAEDEDADGDGVNDEEDEDYVDDNVFPRAVMVVLVIDPTNEYAQRHRLLLAEDITDPDSTADIAATGQMPPFNSRRPYVLIEDEWIRLDPQDPYEGSGTSFDLHVAERGVRGTERATHDSGVELTFGQTFTRVIRNPAARDYR